MEDLDTLIADNMGLVYTQLHRFNRMNDDEAFSQAMEALMNAARTFDASKGFKFSTYATVCIYNALGCYLRTLNKKRQILLVSYDEYLDNSEDLQLIDTLASDEPTPEEAILKEEQIIYVRKAFAKVLSEITNPTAKRVIEYWASQDFETSQTDMAKALGIAQPTVSRALSAFKHKMRLEMEEYNGKSSKRH